MERRNHRMDLIAQRNNPTPAALHLIPGAASPRSLQPVAEMESECHLVQSYSHAGELGPGPLPLPSSPLPPAQGTEGTRRQK